MTASAPAIPASAWAGGKTPSYGLRVSIADRDRHFDRAWDAVTLSLPDGSKVDAPITPGFWNKCSEVRSPEIGRWFVASGLAPWPKGTPPRFELRMLGPVRFEVRVAE